MGEHAGDQWQQVKAEDGQVYFWNPGKTLMSDPPPPHTHTPFLPPPPPPFPPSLSLPLSRSLSLPTVTDETKWSLGEV